MLSNESNEILAKKLEGKVFVYISFLPLGFQNDGNNFMVCKYFYTVKDGIVYHINKDNSLSNDKDELFDIHHKCICLGEFDETKTYHEKSKFVKGEVLLNFINSI